jgi:hypothetical protein
VAVNVGVVGLGVVGARAARELVETTDVDRLVVTGHRSGREEHLSGVLGQKARPWGSDEDVDVVVLAGESGSQFESARRAIERGRHVVSTSDDPAEVEALLALDDEARASGVSVAVGVAFSPGLSCLLAAHAASLFDEVDEVQVAMVGVAGPACGHQRRELLVRDGRDWRDGGWHPTAGGTEQELLWFPDPIGARDCARGALAEPALLHRLFPDAGRVGARAGLERVERLRGLFGRTPSVVPEGGPGAVRVDVRGRVDGESSSIVYAAMDRPSLGAGVTAAVVALELAAGRCALGAGGAAELVEPLPVLTELARRGIRAATFEQD